MQRFGSYVPGRVLLPLFVLVLLLSVALLAGKWSGHHGAAPAAAAASPTPGTAGKVYVLNTLNGEPFLFGVNPIGLAMIGDDYCSLTVLTISFPAIVQWVYWPWDDEPPCDQPGVPARICYGQDLCSEEFIFTGDDVTVHMEYGPILPDAADLPLVTIRFAHDGSPQPVTLLAWSFGSGTVLCGGGANDPITLSTIVMFFPPAPRKVCETIGLQVEASFKTEEFGDLEASFTWLGKAFTLEVDTGALLATPTASPTVSPSPTPTSANTAAPSATASTPAALPDTGGPPKSIAPKWLVRADYRSANAKWKGQLAVAIDRLRSGRMMGARTSEWGVMIVGPCSARRRNRRATTVATPRAYARRSCLRGLSGDRAIAPGDPVGKRWKRCLRGCGPAR